MINIKMSTSLIYLPYPTYVYNFRNDGNFAFLQSAQNEFSCSLVGWSDWAIAFCLFVSPVALRHMNNVPAPFRHQLWAIVYFWLFCVKFLKVTQFLATFT
jgi:hypothetical protein